MKTVLITGAAKRLGAHIATHLHELGFNIVLHYHQSKQEAQTLCKHLLQKRPLSAYLVQANLCAKDGAEQLIAQISQLETDIDITIHNASIYNASDLSFDDFFQLHVKSPYFINKGLHHQLKINRGCIINITDVQALRPIPHHSAYIQSKAALHSQTQCLAMEFAPEIRVNEIAPGKILAPTHCTTEIEAEVLKKIPLKRRGTPADIAKAAHFLIEADYITGQTIVVDGGRILYNP